MSRNHFDDLRDFLPKRIGIMDIYKKAALTFIITGILSAIYYKNMDKSKYIIDSRDLTQKQKEQINGVCYVGFTLLLCSFMSSVLFRVLVYTENWQKNGDWLVWESWFKGMWPFPTD